MTVLEQVVETSTKKRPSTKTAYRAAVRVFLAFSNGELSGAAVERWRDALLAGGLSPRTVNCKLAAIRFASKRFEVRHRTAELSAVHRTPTWAPSREQASGGQDPVDVGGRGEPREHA